jgi:hypothetical protein
MIFLRILFFYILLAVVRRVDGEISICNCGIDAIRLEN